MPNGSERRRFPRNRCRDLTRVHFDGQTVACLIADRSDGGLRLQFRENIELPDTFHVDTPSRRSVSVVWRTAQDCGVIFASG